MNNIVTTDTNTNVVVVTAPGPSGPIGPQGPTGSAGTIQTNSGTIVSPFLNVNGSTIITGSLIVSGSNTFINIGPAQFTGSVGVSGSLFATLFSGSGAGLTGIPASGISGLNLNRIASGSISASVSPIGKAFDLIKNSNSIFNVDQFGNISGSGLYISGSSIYIDGPTIRLYGNATLNDAAITTTATTTTDRIQSGTITASVATLGNAFTLQAGGDTIFEVGIDGVLSGSGANLFNIPASGITGLNLSQIGSGSYTASIADDKFKVNTDSEITGSLIVTGGTSGSFSGSFIGNGAGLVNIPASGITGLNLSRVATGSISASVNIGSTSFEVVSGSSTLLSVSNVGTVVVSSSINIGNAEDGDYTDGLYTDITPSTTVGTMVDRFNEILKGLSPAPAPDLDNLEGITSTGINSIILGFGAAAPTSSYSNVTGTGSLSAVNFTGTFSRSTGAGGGYLRMGTFSATTTLSIRLNEDVAADGSPFTNYPANSFNVPVAGGEPYTLEINGNTYTETPSGTNSLSGTYFTLTAAATGFFPATGLLFNIFRNRQGTVSIPAGLWRNGWNFIKVKQGSTQTNFVDWVYDPAAASGNFAYVFNNFTTASVSPTGEKALSGIKYYTGFSYNVTGSITNYYKNVYNTSAKTFSSVTSGVTAASVSITTPTTVEDLIQVNSSHTLAASSIRLLSGTLTSTLSITNNFSKTGTTGAITTPTILLDNTDTANSNTAENFCLEDRRVPSSSYDTQGAASSALGTFPSASTLGSSDLAVYAGTLRYPTQVLNSGNVSGAGIVYAISSQPDYSSTSGDRWFFRTFRNGGNAVATFTLGISGTSVTFTPFGGTLSGNAVKIWIKVPGKTGWRDIMTAAPGSTAGIATNDNVGCQTGGAPSNITSQATRTIGIDLKTEAMLPSDYFLVRVQTSSGWVGTINQISLTGL
jgi:hypothetical protein